MSVHLKINIKGASKKLIQLDYEYVYSDGESIYIRDLLENTVEITFKRYEESVTDQRNVETSNQDLISDKSDSVVHLLKVLSNREINEMADQGKVNFGVHYNMNKTSLLEAKENAFQCFKDGLVAVFVDEERYEGLEDKVLIQDGSQITFVKLTFLAGRMW